VTTGWSNSRDESKVGYGSNGAVFASDDDDDYYYY
jgi:hypothetical protein